MIVEELITELAPVPDSHMVFIQCVPGQSMMVWHNRVAIMVDGEFVPTFYCDGDPELREIPRERQVPCILITTPKVYT